MIWSHHLFYEFFRLIWFFFYFLKLIFLFLFFNAILIDIYSSFFRLVKSFIILDY
jgi:hypothetical protein